MLLYHLLVPIYLCLGLVSRASAQKLETIYEWKWIDYLWNSDWDRAAAIESGNYDYRKPIIIDTDVSKDGRVFVTMVRGDGVPASLATISDRVGNGGPLLKPYPDWSWTKRGDCNGITNVYRVAIDECNRIWVIDNGKIGGKKICPAQLLAFDLNTDHLLRRVRIPDHIAYNIKTKDGMLITPIVETQGRHCQKTHVYIADVEGSALVVYNGTSVWRLESLVYGPQKSAADFEIAGETFNMADGVLGMALSPERQHQHRFLMFRPLASYDMVSAETWNLQSSYTGSPVRYTVTSGALPSQAVAMAFSSQGILFFGLSREMALACWNMDNPLTRTNINLVDRNRITNQFPSGLKVKSSRVTGSSEQVWMATNRYQKRAAGTQNFNEINFRIMAASVDSLIAGTNCDPRLNFKKILPSNHHRIYYDASPDLKLSQKYEYSVHI